jgi:hypothetical protein
MVAPRIYGSMPFGQGRISFPVSSTAIHSLPRNHKPRNDSLLRLLFSLSPDDQKIVAALAERLAGRGGGV